MNTKKVMTMGLEECNIFGTIAYIYGAIYQYVRDRRVINRRYRILSRGVRILGRLFHVRYVGVSLFDINISL